MKLLLLMFCLGIIAAPPAFAEGRDPSKLIPNPQLGREWPQPDAEEAARLPEEGCKPQHEIVVPENRAERMKWYKSADGLCNSWYKMHILELKMVDPEAAKAGLEMLQKSQPAAAPQ